MAEPVETHPASRDASALPAVDRGAVRQLEEQLGGEALIELVTMFLDRAPDRLTELRDAARAGEASILRQAAQSLKGNARSFGAAEMAEIAARIERDSAAGSLQHAEELIRALVVSLERTRAELEHQLVRPPSRAGA